MFENIERSQQLCILLQLQPTVQSYSLRIGKFFRLIIDSLLDSQMTYSCNIFGEYRPAYLYRFSRDIPILALNHDFPISCGGVPILEDAGILGLSDFGLFCFRRYSRILPAFCTYRQSRRCVAAINSPPYVMNQC